METEKLTQIPKPEPEIPRELSKLSGNVTDLEVTIAELLNKLSPALRSQEDNAVENLTKPEITTELGGMIRQFIYRIRTLQDKTVESLNTIEL